jgi:hypothetical protein
VLPRSGGMFSLNQASERRPKKKARKRAVSNTRGGISK